MASLFLRPPQTQQSNSLDAAAASQPVWPGRLASAQLSGDQAVRRPLEVSELVSQLDAAPIDTLHGNNLPTPQLPAWATPPSPLDHLISQGTAPPWKHAPAAEPLEPVGTWFNGPESAGNLPSTQPPQRGQRDVPFDISGDTQRVSASHTADPRMPPPWPAPQPWPALATGSAEPHPAVENLNSQTPQISPPPRSIASLAGVAGDWPRVTRPSSVAATPAGTQVSLQPAGAQAAVKETEPIQPDSQAPAAGPAQRPAQFVFQPGYGGR